MREIKFRAWDIKLKKMRNWEWLKGKKFPGLEDECGWLVCPELYHLMQFTGFKDRNGKEIYDGDIVCVCGHGIESEISWEYGSWQMKNGCMLDSFRECYLEVIGNIYENPELLKSNANNPTT